MMQNFLLIFLLFPVAANALNENGPFRDVPAAKSVEESKRLFPDRAKSLLHYYSSQELGAFNRDNGIEFPVKALAKLKMGVDVEAVNRAILDPKAVAYGIVGTSFYALKPLCIRDGDYDFALRGWVELIYQMGDKPDLLYPESKAKILNTFLTETGNQVAKFRKFCGFVRVNETENHILLTEGSRYLTNQLWRKIKHAQGEDDSLYDNNKNGMTQFLLTHLAEFLKKDFEEYNSRPYKKFTLGALHNIYEYSEDAAVKEVTRMILDYLAVKVASSSKGLRRVVPFCRQPRHREDLDILEGDSLSVTMALLAGNYDLLDQYPESVKLDQWNLVGLAAGSYRIDDLILDLMVNGNKKDRDFFQLYHHNGFELYASSEKYILSAGGKFINLADAGSGKRDGWAVPITVIPAVDGISKPQLIRILGDRRENKKANLCVTKNFACGLNVMIPDEIPDACQEKVGAWTFLNFDKPECSKKYGFYAAVYRAPCDSVRCRSGASNFGFFELQDSAKMSYEAFKAEVLKNNENFKTTRWNSYNNSEGKTIEFHPNLASKTLYPIRDERYPSIQGSMKRWDHAWGDLMSSTGTGIVKITNPFTKQTLIFDVRDPLKPVRSYP